MLFRARLNPPFHNPACRQRDPSIRLVATPTKAVGIPTTRERILFFYCACSLTAVGFQPVAQ
jgi:hypothetical protein